jgi:hypothetical protein
VPPIRLRWRVKKASLVLTPMKLRVISDYGATEHVAAELATAELVRETMESIDWHSFHQVVLEQTNGDWIEAGGSLDPSNGFSLMYEEGGREFVVGTPPDTVNEMTVALLRYLSGGAEWKEAYDWS